MNGMVPQQASLAQSWMTTALPHGRPTFNPHPIVDLFSNLERGTAQEISIIETALDEAQQWMDDPRV
jgi:hypothetical protein